MFSTAITPPAALCGKRENAYLLSLNGLGYFITRRLSCQELFPIFYRISPAPSPAQRSKITFFNGERRKFSYFSPSFIKFYLFAD
jgi:hypothetical protein